MTQGIDMELAALRRMTPGGLRGKYLEVFGEPSRSGNKDYLFKRIAWRLQSLAEGTLSERARRRAAELARDTDLRMTVPRPPKTSPDATTVVAPLAARGPRPLMPGTVLTRAYRGRNVIVTVLAKGFEYDGQVYRSLTAVAEAVTGTHWSGNLFFRINKGAAREA